MQALRYAVSGGIAKHKVSIYALPQNSGCRCNCHQGNKFESRPSKPWGPGSSFYGSCHLEGACLNSFVSLTCDDRSFPPKGLICGAQVSIVWPGIFNLRKEKSLEKIIASGRYVSHITICRTQSSRKSWTVCESQNGTNVPLTTLYILACGKFYLLPYMISSCLFKPFATPL